MPEPQKPASPLSEMTAEDVARKLPMLLARAYGALVYYDALTKRIYELGPGAGSDALLKEVTGFIVKMMTLYPTPTHLRKDAAFLRALSTEGAFVTKQEFASLQQQSKPQPKTSKGFDWDAVFGSNLGGS